MKCKTCNKELNPYTPKPYCDIDCEKKYPKAEMPEGFKSIFGGLYK